MSDDSYLVQIASLHGRHLNDWIGSQPSRELMWWEGVLEDVETATSWVRDMPLGVRLDLLNLGGRLLAAAAERGDIPYWFTAYWQLRLAVGAVRSKALDPDLMAAITPEGAVRWALDNMPTSRDDLITYAAERAEYYGDRDPYASAGDDKSSYGEPNPLFRALLDVQRVLAALEWIDGSQLQDRTRAEAEAWISIQSILSV
jgi:hypothetical protein